MHAQLVFQHAVTCMYITKEKPQLHQRLLVEVQLQNGFCHSIAYQQMKFSPFYPAYKYFTQMIHILLQSVGPIMSLCCSQSYLAIFNNNIIRIHRYCIQISFNKSINTRFDKFYTKAPPSKPWGKNQLPWSNSQMPQGKMFMTCIPSLYTSISL